MIINHYLKIFGLTIISFILSFTIGATNISEKSIINGKVTDSSTNEGIPFASLYFHELSTGISTDMDGNFSTSFNYRGKLKISISYVGYQTLDTIVNLPNNGELVFKLQKQSYALSEVIVSATEGDLSNSTSLIRKSAMQHVQPSSFADLLELLPGFSSKETNLSKANLISMRQAGEDINTSLGTAFIVDGMALTNDGNLQSFYGITSDLNIKERFTTSKGIDMRNIPTDQIETVEVVRGIPSAKYGDLTAGLVRIELKNGETPWEGRVKVDLKNKLFSVGKGFILPNKGGILNVDIDYAKYNDDVRSDLTTYSRTTASGRYENRIGLSDKIDWVMKFNASYTGSFDKVKQDKDALTKDERFKTDYNSFSVAARGGLKIKESFFKEVNYEISYTHTTENMDRVKIITGGVAPLTTISTEEGSFETGYLPAEYTSQLKIKGKPINFIANIDSKSNIQHGSFLHALLYGFDFRYTANKGEGEIYDPKLPPYIGGKSIRPRAYSDIPALQKLSFYVEDKIRADVGQSNLVLEPGLRVTTLLGIDKQYKMRGKYYLEPRINMRFTFPEFSITGRKSIFAITGGAGKFYKFPTMAQLYPDDLYFDYKELDYYSTSNPDFSYAQIRTFIESPVNHNLEPAKNIKYEAGFLFKVGQIKLDVTYFREMMNNGFTQENKVALHYYKLYDVESVKNPVSKPPLSALEYTDENIADVYSQTENKAKIYKKGIEYTLDLGQINPISTRIRINGAWFSTHYSSNAARYYKPSAVINKKLYPYVGVYDYDKNNDRRSQFNTNIYFDTHIPFLRMIFTTSIQTMWFQMRQTDYYSGLPIAYIDDFGNRLDFTPGMETDNIFKHMVDSYNDYAFGKDRTAIASRLNLKLSKEIGNNIRLACYFNNVLTYLPDYTSYRGTLITNRSKSNTESPYFGAELNVKF